MLLLICHFLAAAAFAQTPSNESPIASGGAKVPTCASELERWVTPRTQPQDCLLGIGDAVNIEFGESFTPPAVISHDGTIVLPLIGKVQAANVTVSQLTANINKLLSNVADPIILTLGDNEKQPRYYVYGGVVQPGRYALLAPVTVQEAIDKAEGFKRAAHNHKIVVLRQRSVALELDYKGLLKHPERNISVQNGDHVIIYRSR